MYLPESLEGERSDSGGEEGSERYEEGKEGRVLGGGGVLGGKGKWGEKRWEGVGRAEKLERGEGGRESVSCHLLMILKSSSTPLGVKPGSWLLP